MFQKLFSILKKQMENILTTTQSEITIFFYVYDKMDRSSIQTDFLRLMVYKVVPSIERTFNNLQLLFGMCHPFSIFSFLLSRSVVLILSFSSILS